MIRIIINEAAYAAILNGRSPDSVQALKEARGGGFEFWLLPALLAKLEAARGPAESFSDAIVRLAANG